MLSNFRGKNTDKVRAIYLVTGVKQPAAGQDEDAVPTREIVLVPEDKLSSESVSQDA
jgi:F420-0:gamma-glutamyl ligase